MTLIDPAIARQFDRLPPHAVESEMCVLGSALIDAKNVIPELRVLVKPEHFYQADHQIMWESALAVYDRNHGHVDGVLLAEELARRQLLEEVGGRAYLAQILNSVPSSAHAVHYAGDVIAKSKLRQLIALSNDILRDCYKPTNDWDAADGIAARAEGALRLLRDTGFTDTIKSLHDLVHDLVSRKADKLVEREPTGYRELDELIGGIPVGGFTIVSGKPGMGKSQLCKNIIKNFAKRGRKCGIVSIEETGFKIASNYLSDASGVSNNRIVYNTLVEQDWTEIMAALPGVAQLPIWIDDAAHTMSAIDRSVRRMVAKYGVEAVIIDHIHLVDAEPDKGMSREQEISKISRGCKQLFKELSLRGIAAAQTNRKGEANEDSLPELSHLRDSGSLEADGDLIIQLHRRDYYRWKREGDNFRPDHKLEVFINKNKDGAMGSVPLHFDGEHQRVSDWQGGGESDCPL